MKGERNRGTNVVRLSPGNVTPTLTILLLCFLLLVTPAASGSPPNSKSDLEGIYDPGIPRSVSVEWSYPTGFSLGIDSGCRLRIGDGDPSSSRDPAKANAIPLSFLMKYSLFQGRLISQSIGFGLGPYFLHQGQMPMQLKDVDVTGSSTCVTEWVSHLSQDLRINLKMRYTHAFQLMVDDIPLWDFTTWVGMNFKW
jgi:hypothetical protein